MRNVLRSAAVVAAGAVVTATLAAPATAAPADRGGEWLQGELTDGIIVNETFDPDFRDYGLTADVAMAFAEIRQAAPLAEVSDALAAEVDSYTTGADFGAPDDVYAGPVAKLTVVAQVAGDDPRAYGGVDLVQRLNGRVATTAPIAGRIEDRSDFGDFANTIGQAFAARGLARAGSGRADHVVRFLLKQQCSAGFFRLEFSGKRKADQSCDAASAANRAPDTDATALAVLALRALPKADRTRATRTAATDAVAWLKLRQKPNGSFGGGVATEASNANSTGLAAWALGDAGACRPARQAAGWVRDLQVPDGATGQLAGDDGAIAYDRGAFAEGEANGITDGATDQWRRATAQAAPGLASAAGC